MIKIEHTNVFGFETAVHGMRNPKNSWNRADSYYDEDGFHLGENDAKLCKTLSSAGTEHRKFMRFIHVQMDATAPLYWWKEFDTYKVGTAANSCSTMHKLADKEFTLDDFSHEHLYHLAEARLKDIIDDLNLYRSFYLESKNKEDWWQMVQLLPSSYNQKRTIDLNYEVLMNIYRQRRNHKLDEWHIFCDWIENLPYMKEFLKG